MKRRMEKLECQECGNHVLEVLVCSDTRQVEAIYCRECFARVLPYNLGDEKEVK